MSPLHVNSSLIDITPAEPVALSGYANRKGLSTTVHRPLSSRCVVFRAGPERVCLVVNDLVDIIPEKTHEIIRRIAGESGLPPDRILIAAIHTHSAPIMEDGYTAANDRYIEWAVPRIVQNAVLAIRENGTAPVCTLRTGSARSTISANRRLVDPQTGIAAKVSNREGSIDQEVGILNIANDAGSSVVTLFNFACHPVVLGFDSVVVSTDYPGAARETVERSLGGMAVFLNGAAGDINPFMTDQTDPAVADGEGRKLGLAVTGATLEAWTGSPRIDVRRRIVELPYRDRDLTAERINGEVDRRLDEQTEFHEWKKDLRKWGDLMIQRLNAEGLPNSCTVEMSAMSLGPVLFLFSQGEVFNEYQIRIKRAFPDRKVFIVSYTNGTRSYIPTAEAFQHKGYEVDQAYVYSEEPSPLTPEADRVYMQAAEDLLRRVG
jgi:neutral ceramidase